MVTTYLAQKIGTQEFYSYTWSANDELFILEQKVDKTQFEIVQVEIFTIPI
jgi:hypothetical protein